MKDIPNGFCSYFYIFLVFLPPVSNNTGGKRKEKYVMRKPLK